MAPSWLLSVDFGTSFTVTAVRPAGRAAEVIEIDGDRRVPSVVYVDDDGPILVGRTADERGRFDPSRALRSPKTRIGDKSPVILGGRQHRMVDLVAAVLAHVGTEAERHMGSRPDAVRLTHPATWSRTRQSSLLDAAERAGLRDPVLVPEPIASAVAYADDAGLPVGTHVLVYDLGGGTFDTAILKATPNGFIVVGHPVGDPTNGGELFDEMLANLIGEHLDPTDWEALNVSERPEWQRAAAGLRAEARRAKETLSNSDVADVLVGLPTGMTQLRVTRDDYERLIRPHIEDSVDVLAQVLEHADLTPSDIDAIYLAGGASRTPLVTKVLSEHFPQTPISRRGDPKLAVAIGATSSLATPSHESIPRPPDSDDRPSPEPVPPTPDTGRSNHTEPVPDPLPPPPPERPEPAPAAPASRRGRRPVAIAALTLAAAGAAAIVATVALNDDEKAGAGDGLTREERMLAALPGANDVAGPGDWGQSRAYPSFPVCANGFEASGGYRRPAALAQEAEPPREEPVAAESDALGVRIGFEASGAGQTAGAVIWYSRASTFADASELLDEWRDAFDCPSSYDDRRTVPVTPALPGCPIGTSFGFVSEYLDSDSSDVMRATSIAGMQCDRYIAVWYMDHDLQLSLRENLGYADAYFKNGAEELIELAEKG